VTERARRVAAPSAGTQTGSGRVAREPSDPSGHWRSNRTAIAVLLCLWFAVTFLVAWFAPALDWEFFGWRFSYYLSAQGAPLACLGIVVFYAWYMRRVDRRSRLDEQDEP
jgi:putative solute:sodium symporter small subunit